MRKLFAALVSLCLFVGLAIAAEVTVVKYDAAKKELTVKEEGKEKTYKVGEKAAKAAEKAKEGAKIDVTTEGDTIVAIKGKKKDK